MKCFKNYNNNETQAQSFTYVMKCSHLRIRQRGTILALKPQNKSFPFCHLFHLRVDLKLPSDVLI